MSGVHKMETAGRRDTITLATATAYKLFTGAGSATYPRSFINFNNTDATAEFYIKFTNANEVQPTITATDNDLIVPAKTPVQLWVGHGIHVWIYHTKGSNATASAVEGHTT